LQAFLGPKITKPCPVKAFSGQILHPAWARNGDDPLLKFGISAAQKSLSDISLLQAKIRVILPDSPWWELPRAQSEEISALGHKTHWNKYYMNLRMNQLAILRGKEAIKPVNFCSCYSGTSAVAGTSYDGTNFETQCW
jgi:hypothetical protein